MSAADPSNKTQHLHSRWFIFSPENSCSGAAFSWRTGLSTSSWSWLGTPRSGSAAAPGPITAEHCVQCQPITAHLGPPVAPPRSICLLANLAQYAIEIEISKSEEDIGYLAPVLCAGVGGEDRAHVLVSAANRLIGEVVQSRRRPLLGPSPG